MKRPIFNRNTGLPKWLAALLAVILTLGIGSQGQSVPEAAPAATSALRWATFSLEDTKAFTKMGNHSLQIDTSDRPRVVYGGDGLYYARWTGSVWQTETVDSSPGVGEYASLALDSSNQAYISYYDSVHQDLKYAKWSNTTNSWTITVIDEDDEVGGFSSIDLDSSNRPHIIYFDDTHDDLKYARWTGSDWRIEKVDSTDVVGLYTSMYIDSGNRIHISYYDFTHKALKYAVRSATGTTWSFKTVDDPANGDGVGSYSSIDVDIFGFAHISYYDSTNDRLKYARQNGTADWEIDVVEDNGGKFSSIETDNFGVPHISYFSEVADNLRHATKPGNTWQAENVDTSGIVGYYTSLQVDDGDDVHITYLRADNGEFKHAELVNDWNITVIDATADLGRYSSLAAGSNGQTYISYYDGPQGNLKFAQVNGSTPQIVIVDSGGDVGKYSSIGLNSTNDPSVAYYDASNSALKFATRVGTSWTVQTIDNAADVGQYSSLDIDHNGIPHMAYYDATNSALKYAAKGATSWYIASLDTENDVGKYSSIALDSKGFPHIAYYDETNTALKYVYWTGDGWIYLVADNAADVGKFISMDIDALDNSHISYYDATNNTIKYAYRNGNTWTVQTVTGLGTLSTLRLASPTSSADWATSLKVDSANIPTIAYYHAGGGELQFARLDGSNWVISTVDSEGDVGQYASLDYNELDIPFISYFDVGNMNLKLAVGLTPLLYFPTIHR